MKNNILMLIWMCIVSCGGDSNKNAADFKAKETPAEIASEKSDTMQAEESTEETVEDTADSKSEETPAETASEKSDTTKTEEIVENISELWDNGQKYRAEDKLKESIVYYKTILEKYPSDDLAAAAQFQIADIYLNDVKDFEFAIEEFKNVIDKYPHHEVSKKSLFMIAYIYNNYLNAYSDAIITYKLFKEKYPNDELVPSVEYELNGLKDKQSAIDSLNSTVNEKSNN